MAGGHRPFRRHALGTMQYRRMAAWLTLAYLQGRLARIMALEKRFEDDLFHLCTHPIRGASRSCA